MTDDRIRALASSSPTPNLTRQLGEELDTAKQLILELAASFKRLDTLKPKLEDLGLGGIHFELGDIGNSAYATHLLVTAAKDRPGFALPRQAA